MNVYCTTKKNNPTPKTTPTLLVSPYNGAQLDRSLVLFLCVIVRLRLLVSPEVEPLEELQRLPLGSHR
jgi:hypothetical protein